MCCLIYKFLLILTQKMQISFLKILPENALKFVSKKMRICVKNFAQLHASVKYVNQEYLARTSGIMSAVSIAAMPVLSFLISGLVSFVTTAQCFIFAGVCALLECIWILKNKGIEGNM